MKRIPMFYVMQINLENGWTMFNCDLGSWAHRLNARGVKCYPKAQADEIIKKSVESDKRFYPACWQRYKYVLVEM